MLPAIVIADPELGLPPHITAAAGMGAVALAEACCAFHPAGRYAAQGMKIIWRILAPCCRHDGSDIEARERMLVAGSRC